jgi:hypothetical protein
MSFAAILKGAEHPMMYAESFDRVHYTGAIAHAVMQHNLQFQPISPGPQEYLAHSYSTSDPSAGSKDGNHYSDGRCALEIERCHQ